jgi:hypothetical protein
MGRPRKNQPKQAPKKNSEYTNKFWRGNVFIKGVGVVNGAVRNDHLEKFKAEQKRIKIQSKLSDQDQPEFNIDDWVKDVDELELKRQRDRKASKNKK